MEINDDISFSVESCRVLGFLVGEELVPIVKNGVLSVTDLAFGLQNFSKTKSGAAGQPDIPLIKVFSTIRKNEIVSLPVNRPLHGLDQSQPPEVLIDHGVVS